jgi:hypothetical protein
VLDDHHLVEALPVHASVGFLLEHLAAPVVLPCLPAAQPGWTCTPPSACSDYRLKDSRAGM